MSYNSQNIGVDVRLAEYMFSSNKKDVNFSIARVMVQKLSEMHDITIEEIASLSNTTPASVTKFCHKLKYDSFKELRTTAIRDKSSTIFRSVQLKAKEEGVEAALDFFNGEIQKRFTEAFATFDMAQIERIAKRLNISKGTAVFCGMHGFPAANLFWEMLTPFEIPVYEINRDSENAVLTSLLDSEDIIFIISLTGQWMNKRAPKLNINEGIAEKIILITYQNPCEVEHRSLCGEIVSLASYNNLFGSNYMSTSLLQSFFILLTTYLGIVRG